MQDWVFRLGAWRLHLQILVGIEANIRVYKPRITTRPPPPGFSELPTALLHSASWLGAYSPILCSLYT